MNAQEIEKLIASVNADLLETKNQKKIDEALEQLANTEGWHIYVKYLNRIKAGLLQPVDIKDVESTTQINIIGAMTIANARTIQVIDTIINYVESIITAKEMQQQQNINNLSNED